LAGSARAAFLAQARADNAALRQRLECASSIRADLVSTTAVPLTPTLSPAEGERVGVRGRIGGGVEIRQFNPVSDEPVPGPPFLAALSTGAEQTE